MWKHMPEDEELAPRERPKWIKVGAIAVVGFVVGIAWPRVLGVRLGPATPAETTANAQRGGRAPEAPSVSLTSKVAFPDVAKPAAPAAPAASAAPAEAAIVAPKETSGDEAPPAREATSEGSAVRSNVHVRNGKVLSCRTSDGATKKEAACGSVRALDAVVRPRLRKLASCGSLGSQTGKLSVVVSADFERDKLTYDLGKSSTIDRADAVMTCVKANFDGASLANASHDHPRYTVAYTATVSTGSDSEEPEAAKHERRREISEARAKTRHDEEPVAERRTRETRHESTSTGSSDATIGWESAPVREEPRVGALVSRLPQGTKVKVGATKDGWVRVSFGDGFAREGWVHRSAIGR